jgi:excisionase family DNA binding protein
MATITVTLASMQTGIPRRTLQDAINRGDLKAMKLGTNTAAYLIDETDLDTYLAQRSA